ncbi:pyridoxal phosphate-dependent aminotransferase [Enterococcus sp. ALS3]|uniref:Pyridoxal phosphate-dependent aminotransferase n=1 Tax=Enterococcus alishanensis TaxID=1303817 RepID=A0ABS6THA2_9ENTE|nr:MalY/PatB family protein [Enterococcus alishanensis]MBV7392294.1 pyridoxal phosphate-dependent aminotransferase [Enterococcus alishanensis]
MVNFDQEINRTGTQSIKWDEINKMHNESGLLPLWIADMDFKAPEGVIDSYQKLLNHGIFGYTAASDDLFSALINWEKKRYNLSLTTENILLFTSVLAGITTAIQTFTQANDAVLIHDPVYPPFADIVKRNKRKLVRSRLIEEKGQFKMDFSDMEEKFKKQNIKAFILCNPHNPGGRVWSKAELTQLGELCKKYHVIVLADEIHQDLVFKPAEMTSFLTAGSFDDFAIKFTSVTKTFNLAGIKSAVAIVKNPALKTRLEQYQQMNFQHEVNTFGMVGMQAAYETGGEWLAELLVYLKKNIAYTLEFFAENLPKVKIMQPEGTYLLWLDFSEYGLTDEALENKLVHEGKVVLNPGISYGSGGAHHMRLNVACPLKTLQAGLERIKKCL